MLSLIECRLSSKLVTSHLISSNPYQPLLCQSFSNFKRHLFRKLLLLLLLLTKTGVCIGFLHWKAAEKDISHLFRCRINMIDLTHDRLVSVRVTAPLTNDCNYHIQSQMASNQRKDLTSFYIGKHLIDYAELVLSIKQCSSEFPLALSCVLPHG